ncbi:ATP-grasp domain-containing protein [Herbiconiux sp. P15]|uniref:ATP-grasp domain-containing protein n=1 Tax=Herbiconiux liukaitaii TaxID=3342799 RepID=UPI0035B8FD74
MTAVLLTGSRAPVTLDLARRFAAAGAFVVVADSQPALTSASKAVGASYRVPSARFAPWEFAKAIAGIAERHAVSLIVPTCEEIFWLAGVRDTGEVAGLGDRVFAPPLPVLRRLHDKARFADLLAELGIPHPTTRVIDSGIEWRRLSRRRTQTATRTQTASRSGSAAGGESGPVVAKPALSRFGAFTRRIGAGEPLPDVGTLTPEHPWLVQELIEGSEFCVHAVAMAGRLTAFAAYRPVARAGPGAGVAFARLAEHPTPASPPERPTGRSTPVWQGGRDDAGEQDAVAAARDFAERIAAHLHLTGQFGLDLIERGADGVVVLECNPRATSGLHLYTDTDDLPAAFLPHPPAADAAPPAAHIAAPATAPPAADTTPPAADAAALAIVGGLDGSRIARPSSATARLGLPHALYGLPNVRTRAGAIRFLRQTRYRDVLQGGSDRIPLGVLARSLAVQAAVAVRSRSSLLAASTHDIEWNGEPLPPHRRTADIGAITLPPGWAEALVSEATRPGGTRDLAPNIDVRMETLQVGDDLLPVTLPREADLPARAPRPPQSYVVSPRTHYLHYSREELTELSSPALRFAAARVIDLLDRLTRPARLDDIAFIGNSLLSTNLQPDPSESAIRAATADLATRHPHLAVGWRSVHGRGSNLPETLRRSGYRLIPSRSVLFLPTRGTAWRRMRDTRRDAELLERSGYRLAPAAIDPATGTSDLATRTRIAHLYDLLYVDKYSALNPRYTAEFVGAAQRTGLLRFTLLERDGRIDGVFGFVVAHGQLAAPVVGYDTARPQEDGLYRMLSYGIASTAHESGVDLHGSSGVAAFKRNRGADAEIEYTAVSTRHLAWPRRAAWAILGTAIDRIAVPLVQRQGL